MTADAQGEARPDSAQNSNSVPRYWIELTDVHRTKRPDRLEGDYRLGRALWSPQRNKGGSDIYSAMREVRDGDVVFHLIDRKSVVGISVAGSSVQDFLGVEGTAWAGQPGYLVPLKDYVELEPPLSRADILSQQHKGYLLDVLGRHKKMFYNRLLDLNQGCYLSELPAELVLHWNGLYEANTGKSLPHVAIGAGERLVSGEENPNTSLQDFDRVTAIRLLINSVAERGFSFEPWQIAAYVTALRTKPFVILAGVTGTGKSKLPALVADSTGGISRLVPVRPDWTDSADVLGYIDLNGAFRPGQLAEIARQAQDNPSVMYVCIVDEMNLARVEHYFAEVLSKIEDRSPNPAGGFRSSPIILQQLSGEHAQYNSVCLPANFAIVGTVNMDESSHGFSRKVLDRAFTLELSDVNLEDWSSSETSGGKPIGQVWPVQAWFPRDIRLASKDSYTEAEQATVSSVIDTLLQVNGYLTPAQLQVGYRTRDELAHFVLNAQDIGELFVDKSGNRVDPLDLGLMMKVLPRICGGSSSIRDVVLQLLGWALSSKPFGDEQDADDTISNWKSSGRAAFLPSAKYPRTAARLCLMLDRLMSDGFTSFWM